MVSSLVCCTTDIYCSSEIGNLSVPGKYKSIKEGRQNLAKYSTSSSYWICSGTYSQTSYPLYSRQQKEGIMYVIYQMQYISSLTVSLNMMHYSSLYGTWKDLCLSHRRIHKECIYDKHSQKNKKIPHIYPSDLQEICPQTLNLGLYKRAQLRRQNGDLWEGGPIYQEERTNKQTNKNPWAQTDHLGCQWEVTSGQMVRENLGPWAQTPVPHLYFRIPAPRSHYQLFF